MQVPLSPTSHNNRFHVEAVNTLANDLFALYFSFRIFVNNKVMNWLLYGLIYIGQIRRSMLTICSSNVSLTIPQRMHNHSHNKQCLLLSFLYQAN